MGSGKRKREETRKEEGQGREKGDSKPETRTKRERESAYAIDLDSGKKLPVISLREFFPKAIFAYLAQSSYTQLLLLLILAGACLRFFNLTYNSLWLDEAATLDIARHSFLEIWDITAQGEFNPPLFYWIEHMMLIFGDSEFVLRLVPAIVGIVTIPVFYLLGKELVDSNVGIITAALLAFSPFHLFYSQEARAYSLVLLFFSIALLFFLRAWKKGESRDWILFGFFGATAFWSHFYVSVPVGILFIAGFVRTLVMGSPEGGELKKAVYSIAAFVIATFPLLVVTAMLFLKRTSSPPTYGIQGTGVIFHTLLQISGYNQILMIFFLLLFGIGIVILFSRGAGHAILIASLLFVPLLVSVPLSKMMPMIPRYLIYLLPAYFLGISASATILYYKMDMRVILGSAVILLLLAGIPFYSSYFSTYSKEDWRGFSGMLYGRTSEGDVVVALPSYMRGPLDYYYSNQTDGTIEFGASRARELHEIASSYAQRRIFYVLTSDIFAANPEGDALKWLEANSTHVGSYTGIHLFISG